jgi:hypothetical protein
MDGLTRGPNPLKELAQPNTAVETQIDPFILLPLQLYIIANPGIHSHPKVVAKPAVEHLQVGHHFPLVPNLNDLPIVVGAHRRVPNVEPGLLPLEPFK